jgi:hypothetical protein
MKLLSWPWNPLLSSNLNIHHGVHKSLGTGRYLSQLNVVQFPKTAIFWDVMLSSLVDGWQRFGGTHSIFGTEWFQWTMNMEVVYSSETLVTITRLHGVLSKKTAVLLFKAVRTSNHIQFQFPTLRSAENSNITLLPILMWTITLTLPSKIWRIPHFPLVLISLLPPKVVIKQIYNPLIL